MIASSPLAPRRSKPFLIKSRGLARARRVGVIATVRSPASGPSSVDRDRLRRLVDVFIHLLAHRHHRLRDLRMRRRCDVECVGLALVDGL